MLIDIVDTIDGKWTFPRETYVAYSFLATVSSALNPIIYGLLNNNFRREYLQLFRCRHCRKQPTVEPSIGKTKEDQTDICHLLKDRSNAQFFLRSARE